MPATPSCLGGMVSAPHHLAAQSGTRVLAEGGDAIEAMVAAAATIAVVYPHMNGIGGDGFWLIAPPDGAPIGVQACGPAAAAATPALYAEHGLAAIPTRGPLAALTVPGAIAGWAAALEIARARGARLPLARLLEDAERHARDGAPISRSQAALTAQKAEELLAQPGFAPLFAPNGLPAVDAVLPNPALAATFARLAEAGLDDFYRGEIGAALGAAAAALGAPLTAADLAAYRALRVAPLSVDIPEGRVFNLPPPCQGVASLMILGVAARLEIARADDAAYVHALVEATKRAFRPRNAMLGDPAFMPEDARAWLTDARLDADAAAIDPRRAAPWPEPMRPGDTIWMGAIDRSGLAVSYIQSVFWEFGSGVVAGETGVLLQNRGASFTLTPGPNALAPGRLPFHTLNPAMARLTTGRTLSYGAMGGDGQPQTQAAIFTRAARFGQSLADAVAAPRWLLGRTWGAETHTLKLENRFPDAVVEGLAALGHEVETLEAYSDVMGHAGMVAIDRSGVISGAADPRADGAAAGV